MADEILNISDPQYADLRIPIIDPRNEADLYQQIISRIVSESRGVLNDYSPAGIISPFAEGFAHGASEVLYYANKLWLGVALGWFSMAGVQQRLGRKALVEITFTLKAPQSGNIRIDRGFEVQSSSGDYPFFTTRDLIIRAGDLQGKVVAEAAEIGADYNLPAYTITVFTQPLPYIDSVFNKAAALGGDDEEPIEETIERGVESLRLRGIVTLPDYENAAEKVLGERGVAKAIKQLGADKSSFTLGAVHLFLLNETGEPANPAQINAVREEFEGKVSAVADGLYISPMDTLPIDCEAEAKLEFNANPDEVAAAMWNAFQNYLSPSKDKVGATLIRNEVEFALRSVPGLKFINPILLNNINEDLVMTSTYTIPIPRQLSLSLVIQDGVILEYQFSNDVVGDVE